MLSHSIPPACERLTLVLAKKWSTPTGPDSCPRWTSEDPQPTSTQLTQSRPPTSYQKATEASPITMCPHPFTWIFTHFIFLPSIRKQGEGGGLIPLGYIENIKRGRSEEWIKTKEKGSRKNVIFFKKDIIKKQDKSELSKKQRGWMT